MAITSDTATISTRLEETQRRALAKLAARNERSLAAELRYAVKVYLELERKVNA